MLAYLLSLLIFIYALLDLVGGQPQEVRTEMTITPSVVNSESKLIEAVTVNEVGFNLIDTDGQA